MGSLVNKTDLEAVWGVDTIAEWANLENADPPVDADARIATAIAWAEAYYRTRMRNGPYLIDLAGMSGDDAIIATNIISEYAGRWLFAGRGLQLDAIGEKVENRFEFAQTTVSQLLDGEIAYSDAALNDIQPSGPEVIP